ncbi:HET-domain-containing protein [Trematosphaeria pertusa]|uniref:HET-domain-containing protein n=1 Tax=Trematosphaeria pertusa TaxID=390896 RepID=A0A6A6IB60_9PLEO|nr:HET-domain-containing protein [Trematosphaeria pertusa]KAF2247298.1 HET-domain-containing protein [Trematosphaeria pertusa]
MTCARKWLSQCLRSHDKCQTPYSTENTRFSPTRLLEIGQPDPPKVRLRLYPNQECNGIQYATLSHCWGASKVLRLTSASFQDLEKGIEISKLAQTFQDAIFTARSLGIHFLWIDSLCIFQDSQKDWQQEAALMSHVYKNSTLNIAASVAADSNAGCFSEKDPSSIGPCMVQTAWIDSYNDTYHLYHEDFWDNTLKNMPLTKRARAVQELLLAPRVLHLCGKQLFWECYNLRACGTYPGGTPPTSLLHWVSGDARWQAFSEAGTRHVAVESSPKHSKTTLLELWHGIVEMYTKCNLTYTTDKLVALSGIAKLMEQALDDEYCAGLWRSRLATELF